MIIVIELPASISFCFFVDSLRCDCETLLEGDADTVLFIALLVRQIHCVDRHVHKSVYALHICTKQCMLDNCIRQWTLHNCIGQCKLHITKQSRLHNCTKQFTLHNCTKQCTLHNYTKLCMQHNCTRQCTLASKLYKTEYAT